MASFNWDFPYTSQRMPVLAANVVATSQPLAAQAGLQMLYRGGNAVDAALAAAIALAIVEPVSNGIGSDAFCILWDGEKLHGLNASGRSPAGWTPEYFAGRDAMPSRGWDAVTAPGCVSAWVELSQRFGKLPFADLFAPAVGYARDGYLVGPVTAHSWAGQAQVLADMPGFAEAFMPGGRVPQAGERFACPDQARTLERIAETEGEAYYRGDLAEQMAAAAAAHGAQLNADDLAAHQCDWVGTASQDYRGYTLHEIPPNGQGLAALIALGILDNKDLAAHPADSADSLHVQIEAVKLALADAYRFIADPEAMDVAVADLLDPAYLAARAALIDMDAAGEPGHGVPERGGTVYLTAADHSGMMVSFIQSNYQGFGSGVVVPGTGISLQNRGAGFVLQEGHPNRVGPRKRPFQTIIPGFLMQDGAPVMSFGLMGGPMQAQGHAQMVVRLADYGQNPQTAADAPRFQVLSGREVAVETDYPAAALDELERRGHLLRRMPRDPMFGGAQLIHRLADGYCAASEPRKEGQAVGF